MNENEAPIHIEDDDARAGETTGVMRYVLGISLLLAVIAMTVVWVVPALTQDDAESAATATQRNEALRDQGVAEEDIPGQSDGNPDLPPTSSATATPAG